MNEHAESPTQNTDGAKWLKEAVEEATRASSPNQPITINITIDNSTHDNRQVTIVNGYQAPQRQRQVAQCHPSRIGITGGYIYDPDAPLLPHGNSYGGDW